MSTIEEFNGSGTAGLYIREDDTTPPLVSERTHVGDPDPSTEPSVKGFIVPYTASYACMSVATGCNNFNSVR